jgi:hypothetical protein
VVLVLRSKRLCSRATDAESRGGCTQRTQQHPDPLPLAGLANVEHLLGDGGGCGCGHGRGKSGRAGNCYRGKNGSVDGSARNG